LFGFLKKRRFGFLNFGSVFRFKTEPAASKLKPENVTIKFKHTRYNKRMTLSEEFTKNIAKEIVQKTNLLSKDCKEISNRPFMTPIIVRLDVAKFSFGSRICEQWNHVPGDVVSSSSVNTPPPPSRFWAM